MAAIRQADHAALGKPSGSKSVVYNFVNSWGADQTLSSAVPWKTAVTMKSKSLETKLRKKVVGVVILVGTCMSKLWRNG